MDFNEAMRSLDDDEPRMTAERHFELQYEKLRWPYVNLSHAWRDLGCPIDKVPPNWVQVAMPFIEGVAAYVVNLDKWRGCPPDRMHEGTIDDHMCIVEETEKTPPEWREGDVLASYFVAMAYARFFDCDIKHKGSDQ